MNNAGLVTRPRLTRILEESSEFGVAMVIAPAGYGKSVAIHDAFGGIGIPIDIGQSDSVDALARAIVARAAPQHLRGLSAYLARPVDETRYAFDRVREIADWVASHLRLIDAPLVFDDFHKVDDRPDLVRFIELLISATIPHVRWIIASRETPRLPVGTWVAHGMAMPIVGDDLAFTALESADLATALNIDIGVHDIETICAEGEGWPLIIRLALGAWERTRSIVPLRIRTRHVLFDFLEEQVWAYLSATDRRLLLAAAVLRDIRPALLDRVGFADAGPALDRLGRKLPLVAKLDSTGFRLHDVFRDFVLERHPHAEEQAALLASAIDAYVAVGEIVPALNLCVQARADARARDLLADHVCDLLASGERAAVASAVNAIKSSYAGDAVVIATLGLFHALDGSDKSAEAALTSVLGAEGLPAKLHTTVRMRLAELYVRRGEADGALKIIEPFVCLTDENQLDWLGLAAAAHGYLGSKAAARASIEAAIPLLDRAKPEERARNALRLAFAFFYLGDLTRAETFAQDAAELGETNVLPSLTARAFSILYSIATTIHVDGFVALHYARQWSRYADEAGEKSILALGLVAVAAVAAELGNDETFEDATVRLRLLRGVTYSRHLVPLRYSRVVYEVGKGNLRNAIIAMDTLDTNDLNGPQRSFRDAVLGMLHAANGEPDVAGAYLHTVALVLAGPEFEARENLAFAIAYRSVGLWLLGRQAEAQRSFTSGIMNNLGERDVITLQVMRAICSTVKSGMTASKLEELTAPLLIAELRGFARFFKAIIRPGNVAKLTRTERAVLTEYHRGSSTSEIAYRMKRSPKTLYNHIDSASRKLGVSGRAALLNVVIDQGLIDQ